MLRPCRRSARVVVDGGCSEWPPYVEGGVEVERVVVQGAGQGVGLGGRHPDGERVRELQAGAQDEPDLSAGQR